MIRRLSLTALVLLIYSSTAGAIDTRYRTLIEQLNQYKADGLLPEYDHWYLRRLPEKPSLPDYFYNQMFVLAKEQLRAKRNIQVIRINEQYVAQDLNIFIVDPKNDPKGILTTYSSANNAASIPNLNLILMDEALLERIMDADVTVSNEPGGPSDFLRVGLKDTVQENNVSFKEILTLQYMNSIAGVDMPAIGITEPNLQEEFYKMKFFVGIWPILHEIGHVVYQHKVGLFSRFSPSKENDNIEIEADNFALSLFAETDYMGLKNVTSTWIPLGFAAELSATLRQVHGVGISDLYYGRSKLQLHYGFFDPHPPLEYRLLLLNNLFMKRRAPQATNPFQKIIDGVTWSLQ